MRAANSTDLIRQLAADATPVRRLPSPWVRTAIWCGVSFPVAAAIVVALALQGEHARDFDWRLVLEQLAALATGVTAAAAAFATTVPGYPRRILLVPVLPFALWLANLGGWCVREGAAFRPGSAWAVHWPCLPITILVGMAPAVILIAMLRQGAPLAPRSTTFLAALAAAGVANFGVRFVHSADPGIVVLVWHFGAVLFLSSLLPLAGRQLFNWPHLVLRMPQTS